MNYKPCRNAMEVLVYEEVDRQLTTSGTVYSQNFDRTDAIAYALNRLPGLYATTEQGWERQMKRARRSLMDLVSMTVTWGIKEAQRKYKPSDTPLAGDHLRHPAERALSELRLIFGREDLSWDNLSAVVHNTLQPLPSATTPQPVLRALSSSYTPEISRTSEHPAKKRQAVSIQSPVDVSTRVKAG
ncbi:MAG: late competence development ComFB family protein [Coleofasciculaceae cyanobacterium RL_1_1]|nr:late competence development ComFB family protein [Coleofasciculaceae cyanobacterium RL_1_1]